MGVINQSLQLGDQRRRIDVAENSLSAVCIQRAIKPGRKPRSITLFESSYGPGLRGPMDVSRHNVLEFFVLS